MQVDVVTVCISKYLHLNMAWSLDVLLNQHVIVAEALHGLPLGSIQLVDELFFAVDDAHAFATTSKNSLEHDWESNLVRFCQQVLGVLIVAVVALQNWHACGYHDLLRFALRPHFANSVRWWAYERQALALEHLDEVSVFGEESIPKNEVEIVNASIVKWCTYPGWMAVALVYLATSSKCGIFK